jgi:crotonobetainyl-CoA:carnitine CoA-transferase CaiB-like acyl-CoA transferase
VATRLNSSVDGQAAPPLHGVRVIDASNLLAGPLAGMLLADYGADVIKIEHPAGADPLRNHGRLKDGEPLWWKQVGRSKRCMTLDLGKPEGQRVLRRLADTADILIESYRPGTFERWGLGYDVLSAANPRLIMLRVTAFGRTGPRSDQPGFGTLAESLSGFVQRNGQPDGPPTLPPFGLGDNVTGIMGAFGAMVALRERDQSGLGQEVDVSITRSLIGMMEPQILEYDQLGTVMTRTGNRSPMNAPRNLYQSQDGHWIAVSTSTQETADRFLMMIGREDIVEQPWFRAANTRAEHVDEIDEAVGGWISAHDAEEVLKQCAEATAPACKVATVEDIVSDPQNIATGVVATTQDPVLGPLRMPNIPLVLSRTPGGIKWPGAALGAHTDEILEEIGLEAQISELRQAGVIR